MVNFYVGRIRAGKMTINDVPALWRNKVKQALGIE